MRRARGEDEMYEDSVVQHLRYLMHIGKWDDVDAIVRSPLFKIRNQGCV